MSDTTEPREEAAASAEPLNDSTEMRDAIRSIEAIGEDRTGAEHADTTDAADEQPDSQDEDQAFESGQRNPDIDLDEDGS